MSPRVPARIPNPFAGAGVARVGDDFTDRADERAAIARALATPRGHLLLVGPRRIGKTSLLEAVRTDIATRPRKGRPEVLYLDLWTASSLEDITTRLAAEAVRVLGRRWGELVRVLAQRLELKLEVGQSASGLLMPVPSLSFRAAPAHVQRQRLVQVLDTLEEQAKAQRVHVGVILDEFQEIERVGRDADDGEGVSPLRQVRAAIQHHAHVTYVLAGSDRALIARLSDPATGPLHNLARRYEIGPLPVAHFAAWIEDRCTHMGIAARGRGAEIIALAGPRTRDVRTLAESATELARSTGKLTSPVILEAMRAVVRERGAQYEVDWKGLTALQQNCLRAVAAGAERLTSGVVREGYALGDTSRTAKALSTLVERHVLVRDGTRHSFDDPFYRAWVVVHALRDVGLDLPITYLPAWGKAPDSA